MNKEIERLQKEIERLNIELNTPGIRFNRNITEPAEELLRGNRVVLSEDTNKAIINDSNALDNVLIEGDNLHTLTYLQDEYKGKIDVITIDPPYNTGNKGFRYKDDFKSNGDKHSQWLNFMNKRLRLAKELLTDEGVIFIHIDDSEQANLKLLCDEIFGEKNFIGSFIWINNAGKNNSKTVCNQYEYVVTYSKDIKKIKANKEIFQVVKDGYNELIDYYNENVKTLSKNEIEAGLRTLYKQHPEWKGLTCYNKVDEFKNSPYASTDLSNHCVYTEAPLINTFAYQECRFYDVIHPITGKPCKRPSNGWSVIESTMKTMIENDLIVFGEDENKQPRKKVYLTDNPTNNQKLIINDNINGKNELDDLFGKAPFNYPKAISLIKTILSGMKKDAIILDFFAGSGTTGHAVLEMNKEDGGNRRFILATNNENQICETVTYERLKKVINGYTGFKTGKVFSPINTNLRYYKIKLEKKER